MNDKERKMKIAGIVLIILQIIATFSVAIYCGSNDTPFFRNIPNTLGHFTFLIVGVVLLIAANTGCFRRANEVDVKKRVKILLIFAAVFLILSAIICLSCYLYGENHYNDEDINIIGAWFFFIYFIALFGWRIIGDIVYLIKDILNTNVTFNDISTYSWKKANILLKFGIAIFVIFALVILLVGTSLAVQFDAKWDDLLEDFPAYYYALIILPILGIALSGILLFFSYRNSKDFYAAFEKSDNQQIAELREKLSKGQITYGEYKTLRKQIVKAWYQSIPKEKPAIETIVEKTEEQQTQETQKKITEWYDRRYR